MGGSCRDDPGGMRTGPGEDVSESIFDYGSKMGQLPYAEGDYWAHDKTTATCTRILAVSRKEFYHPSEGLEGSSSVGPVLANLRDTRVTIPQTGEIIRDNWRKAAMHESPTCALGEWTGKCVLDENCPTGTGETNFIPLLFTPLEKHKHT